MKTLNQRIVELTATLYECFKTQKRDNGDEFLCMYDGIPEWARNIIMHVFDTSRSAFDDLRWEMIKSSVSKLSDYQVDAWSDSIDEMADSLVDVYTMGLLRWVASDLNRYLYVEDYCDNCGTPEDDNHPDFIKMLTGGQYYEYLEILNSLIDSIKEEAQLQFDEAADGDDPSIVEGEIPERAVELRVVVPWKQVPVAIEIPVATKPSKTPKKSRRKPTRK